MARKRKHEHLNHERWLVSYADFITLLFAFFVVLYASSQSDHVKRAQLATAIQQAFTELGTFSGQAIGQQQPTAAATAQQPEIRASSQSGSAASVGGASQEIERLRRELEAVLSEELKKKEVALSVGPDGMIISLREVGFFHSGSAVIRTDAIAAFSRIAQLLKDRACHVRLEGHTDNLPIHTAEFGSNWELSTARATNMVRDLITKYGFAAHHLSAAGFAEHHPVASNSNTEGRSLNRRVDIVVMEPCTATQAAGTEPHLPSSRP